MKVSAVSGANIAFIKYWGYNLRTRAPSNASLSMTFADLVAHTTVEDGHPSDSVELDGKARKGEAGRRVLDHLAMLKKSAGYEGGLRVISKNNFPMGAGVASSASGFSALTLAALKAMGERKTPGEMAALSARASGSSARSFLGGYVAWRGEGQVGQVAKASHWNLIDVVLVISGEEKPVSSSQGQRLAWTSPLHQARLERVADTYQIAEEAVRERDFWALAEVSEEDALMMHAVMMTSTPGLIYWTGGTVEAMRLVRSMRQRGLQAFFTIDAGPNVHVITTRQYLAEVREEASSLPCVEKVLVSGPGDGTRLVKKHLI